MGRDSGVEGRASSSRGVALLVATAARKGARARACARARVEREGGQRQPREAVVQRDLVLRARRAEGGREREREGERERDRERERERERAREREREREKRERE